MLLPVGQLRINFVRHDEKVVLFDHGRDFFERRSVRDRARRVIRIGENENLGTGRDRCFQCFLRRQESVLLPAFHRDGNPVRKQCARRIGCIGGVGNEYLVARLRARPQNEVDRLAGAYRHENMLRVIGKRKTGFEIARNQLQKGRHAAVCRVLRVTLLNGRNRRRTHRPRRDKIRFAYAEGNRAFRLAHDIEKFPDSARL